MGNATTVLGANIDQFAVVRGIGRRRAECIRRAIDALSNGQALAREKQLIDQHKVTLCALGQSIYPSLLQHIPDPPPLLYVQGQLRKDDTLALAVVGTRRCTGYGREQADRLSAACSEAGLCIVSGGARGIDAAAHRAALRCGGRTIAVLGSGLAKPYPPEHQELFADIAGCGAVVSEMPMSAPPVGQNFPRRNRVISGLALGVLVIEAPIGSGAMITARLAAEEHGREVLALPGRVDSPVSAGCHKMVREGWSTLVTRPMEILEALGESGQLLQAGLSDSGVRSSWQPQLETAPRAMSVSAVGLTDTQCCLFKALDQPQTLEQLAACTGLTVSTIQADVTVLEIRGLITRYRGRYQRRMGESNVLASL